jgi:hypothetical protein
MASFPMYFCFFFSLSIFFWLLVALLINNTEEEKKREIKRGQRLNLNNAPWMPVQRLASGDSGAFFLGGGGVDWLAYSPHQKTRNGAINRYPHSI